MNTDIKGALQDLLISLRKDCLHLGSVKHDEYLESAIHKLHEKYGIFVMGENLNIVYAHELAHNIGANIGDMLAVLPSVAQLLGIKLEPLTKLENVGMDIIENYHVTLF